MKGYIKEMLYICSAESSSVTLIEAKSTYVCPLEKTNEPDEFRPSTNMILQLS